MPTTSDRAQHHWAPTGTGRTASSGRTPPSSAAQLSSEQRALIRRLRRTGIGQNALFEAFAELERAAEFGQPPQQHTRMEHDGEQSNRNGESIEQPQLLGENSAASGTVAVPLAAQEEQQQQHQSGAQSPLNEGGSAATAILLLQQLAATAQHHHRQQQQQQHPNTPLLMHFSPGAGPISSSGEAPPLLLAPSSSSPQSDDSPPCSSHSSGVVPTFFIGEALMRAAIAAAQQQQQQHMLNEQEQQVQQQQHELRTAPALFGDANPLDGNNPFFRLLTQQHNNNDDEQHANSVPAQQLCGTASSVQQQQQFSPNISPAANVPISPPWAMPSSLFPAAASAPFQHNGDNIVLGAASPPNRHGLSALNLNAAAALFAANNGRPCSSLSGGGGPQSPPNAPPQQQTTSRPVRSQRTPMKEIVTLDDPRELDDFMAHGEEHCISAMRAFITQYSLRQTTVAMMTGVSQPYISKLLNGNHRELSLRCRKNIYCWYLNCRRHPHKLAAFVQREPCSAARLEMGADGELVPQRRERYVFRPALLRLLEARFAESPFPDTARRVQIAGACNAHLQMEKRGSPLMPKEVVTPQVIANWFANRRKEMRRRGSSNSEQYAMMIAEQRNRLGSLSSNNHWHMQPLQQQHAPQSDVGYGGGSSSSVGSSGASASFSPSPPNSASVGAHPAQLTNALVDGAEARGVEEMLLAHRQQLLLAHHANAVLEPMQNQHQQQSPPLDAAALSCQPAAGPNAFLLEGTTLQTGGQQLSPSDQLVLLALQQHQHHHQQQHAVESVNAAALVQLQLLQQQIGATGAAAPIDGIDQQQQQALHLAALLMGLNGGAAIPQPHDSFGAHADLVVPIKLDQQGAALAAMDQ